MGPSPDRTYLPPHFRLILHRACKFIIKLKRLVKQNGTTAAVVEGSRLGFSFTVVFSTSRVRTGLQRPFRLMKEANPCLFYIYKKKVKVIVSFLEKDLKYD